MSPKNVANTDKILAMAHDFNENPVTGYRVMVNATAKAPIVISVRFMLFISIFC